MDIETIAKAAQRCFASIPTVVLGSGASMPHGLPGMRALSRYLNESVHPEGPDEEEKWSLVSQALGRGAHLEAALDGLNLPASLLHRIVGSTWNCVNEKDSALYRRLYADPFAYPLGELLEALFHSSVNSVDVVTTNYDRVVEYACNSAGLLFQTGFAPGYLQKWDAGEKITFRSGHKEARVVKIWKVHGSLDWFQTADERVIGLPVFTLPDSGVTPLIVTPGLNKYEKTSEDPFRTTINGADTALKRAAAFLCIGFGFRDKHIHPKIIERCREKNVPIVVLAQELTEEAKSFLRSKAGSNYLGIEQANEGSRVFTAEFPDGVAVDAPVLWSMNGFNKLIF
ncbi:SIR2 family protein [Sinorhizobium terangae]|uniref:SIR2 family protein n=1 Tax=Sinorhizobium terangae TaxID=110322 RepID=UPI0024B04312|nr:SIR2 family protein [Sinorhizobium terangae]WFU49140.1 SIR2 family protein [Sinorhizobium terangae]